MLFHPKWQNSGLFSMGAWLDYKEFNYSLATFIYLFIYSLICLIEDNITFQNQLVKLNLVKAISKEWRYEFEILICPHTFILN